MFRRYISIVLQNSIEKPVVICFRQRGGIKHKVSSKRFTPSTKNHYNQEMPKSHQSENHFNSRVRRTRRTMAVSPLAMKSGNLRNSFFLLAIAQHIRLKLFRPKIIIFRNHQQVSRIQFILLQKNLGTNTVIINIPPVYWNGISQWFHPIRHGHSMFHAFPSINSLPGNAFMSAKPVIFIFGNASQVSSAISCRKRG